MTIEIDGKTYKEVKINKLIINGKEQGSQIISADETKSNQELNVTIYTQEQLEEESNEAT